jgi:predicted regulator of Ras-like GTPase activity (Roadblock/LC7/MglB family)
MKSLLQQIIDRIPGAFGAAVVGLDGIPVEKVSVQDGFNIDLASAEVVGIIKRAGGSMGFGSEDPPEEITISSRSSLTILRALGLDYYLCVVVGPDCIPGQVRFETWRAGLHLQETIR